jgi:hypothetical protein
MKCEELDYGLQSADAPPMKSLDEAITGVQGVSSITRAQAINYLLSMPRTATSELKKAVLRLDSDEPDSWLEYRRINLLEALLLRPDDDAKRFIIEQTRAALARPTAAIDWSDIPDETPVAKLLAALLVMPTGRVQSTDPAFRVRLTPMPALADEMRRVVVDAFTRLSGIRIAEATFALRMSDGMPVDRLAALAPRGHDELALGLEWVGAHHHNWGDNKVALTYVRLAKQYAGQSKLVEGIDGNLGRLADMKVTEPSEVHFREANPLQRAPPSPPPPKRTRYVEWIAAGSVGIGAVLAALLMRWRRRRAQT